MPLNAEEKYQQKKFERDQYARPTLEQLEIARLEQQLQRAQNTISHLTEILDLINGLIREERTSDISDEMFKFELCELWGGGYDIRRGTEKDSFKT